MIPTIKKLAVLAAITAPAFAQGPPNTTTPTEQLIKTAGTLLRVYAPEIPKGPDGELVQPTAANTGYKAPTCTQVPYSGPNDLTVDGLVYDCLIFDTTVPGQNIRDIEADNLVFRDCVLFENEIDCTGTNILFENCLFDGNGALFGFDTRIAGAPGGITFRHCTFREYGESFSKGHGYNFFSCTFTDMQADCLKPEGDCVMAGCYLTRWGLNLHGSNDAVQSRFGGNHVFLFNHFDSIFQKPGVYNTESSIRMVSGGGDNDFCVIGWNWLDGGNRTVYTLEQDANSMDDYILIDNIFGGNYDPVDPPGGDLSDTTGGGTLNQQSVLTGNVREAPPNGAPVPLTFTNNVP